MMNTSSKNYAFYVQKKQNYLELKKLNENIITDYKINIPVDSELYNLKQKVEYDENMINGLEPNKDYAVYYWWVLIGLSLTLLIISWLDSERKIIHNNGYQNGFD